MNEAALIQKIRKYLATVPECFFWKEHGGQYGMAADLPDREGQLRNAHR